MKKKDCGMASLLRPEDSGLRRPKEGERVGRGEREKR